VASDGALLNHVVCAPASIAEWPCIGRLRAKRPAWSVSCIPA